MVSRSALLVASLLGGSRADVASEEALSLIQFAAQKHEHKWSGKPAIPPNAGYGFKHCSQVNYGTSSGCTELHSKSGFPHIDALLAARHTQLVAECAKFSFSLGGDSFNFDDGLRCQPLLCSGVDLKLNTDLASSSNSSRNLVYSHHCGQEEVKKESISKMCGSVQQSFKRFQRPHPYACDQRLSFKNMSRNNLHNNGVMVFQEVLPGVVMSLRADENYVNTTANGLSPDDHTFAFLNFRAQDHNNETELLFEFFETGTLEPTTVDAFLFDIADLQVGKDCSGQMSVTPEDFSGYFLHKDPSLAVTSFAGNASAVPKTSFRAVSYHPAKEPLNDRLTEQQARRSVTLLYRNRTNFTMKVAVGPASDGQGSNLKLGGSPVMECDGKLPTHHHNYNQ